MPYIDVTFSKKITGQPNITLSPNVLKSYEIKDKSIRLKLKQMSANTSYTITLNNIHASNGKILNKRLSFKAKNIAFEKLPKDVQQAIIASQDPNDAKLLTNDPLVSHLPYGNIGYNISYVITTKQSKQALVITISVILAGADYKQSSAALQATIDSREQAALNYIRSLGLDPSKYDIQYSVPSH